MNDSAEETQKHFNELRRQDSVHYDNQIDSSARYPSAVTYSVESRNVHALVSSKAHQTKPPGQSIAYRGKCVRSIALTNTRHAF